MSTVILIASIVLAGTVVASPLVLALVVRRRLAVGWRYFAYGALIQVVFEDATHGWLNGGNWAPFLRGRAGGSYVLFIVLLFGWALSSGVCEEVGRYVGYRVFMGREEKTWNKAVMYGLGHGGIETILQNGLPLIVPVALGLTVGPPALLAAAATLWVRAWFASMHVAWSVLVLQIFRRKNIGWLGLAVLFHTAVDFSLFLIIYIANAQVAVQGVVVVIGLISLWTISRLRDNPSASMVLAETRKPPSPHEYTNKK